MSITKKGTSKIFIFPVREMLEESDVDILKMFDWDIDLRYLAEVIGKQCLAELGCLNLQEHYDHKPDLDTIFIEELSNFIDYETQLQLSVSLKYLAFDFEESLRLHIARAVGGNNCIYNKVYWIGNDMAFSIVFPNGIDRR